MAILSSAEFGLAEFGQFEFARQYTSWQVNSDAAASGVGSFNPNSLAYLLSLASMSGAGALSGLARNLSNSDLSSSGAGVASLPVWSVQQRDLNVYGYGDFAGAGYRVNIGAFVWSQLSSIYLGSDALTGSQRSPGFIGIGDASFVSAALQNSATTVSGASGWSVVGGSIQKTDAYAEGSSSAQFGILAYRLMQVDVAGISSVSYPSTKLGMATPGLDGVAATSLSALLLANSDMASAGSSATSIGSVIGLATSINAAGSSSQVWDAKTVNNIRVDLASDGGSVVSLGANYGVPALLTAPGIGAAEFFAGTPVVKGLHIADGGTAIRPIEVRSATRPQEVRTILRSYEGRAVVRPAENRLAVHP